VKAVNLRELKNRLGGYVREVRAGEVVLVTDRGEVVAELRRPLHHTAGVSTFDARLDALAQRGAVQLGLPNSPDAYMAVPHRVAEGVVERLIDEEREGG
jgi:antitoxin (DNA-binding transcriptional repressor) of toxin-antitoxin stability system